MTTTQGAHTIIGKLIMNGITGTGMHTIMVDIDIGIAGTGTGSMDTIAGVIATL